MRKIVLGLMFATAMSGAAFANPSDQEICEGDNHPAAVAVTEFEDTQAALYLLRVSFSAVRATHFMRTTPLSSWEEQAFAFDLNVRGAAEKILGFLGRKWPTSRSLWLRL